MIDQTRDGDRVASRYDYERYRYRDTFEPRRQGSRRSVTGLPVTREVVKSIFARNMYVHEYYSQ